MTPEVLDLFFMEEIMRGRMLPFVQPTRPQCEYLLLLYPKDFENKTPYTWKGFGDKRRLVKETDFECIEYLAFEAAWMKANGK